MQLNNSCIILFFGYTIIGNWDIAPYAVLLCIGPILSMKILSKIKKSAGLTPLKYNPKKKFWVVLTLATVPLLSIPVVIGLGGLQIVSIIGAWDLIAWVIIMIAAVQSSTPTP